MIPVAVRQYRTPILVAVGAVVAAAVVLLAWAVPDGHTLSALDAQKQTLASQEQLLQAQIIALQHDQNQKVSNCTTLTTLVNEIPPALDESQFVLDIGTLAQHSGDASIPSLTWGASSTGSGVDSIAVTLNLQGTFGQVMTFVKGLDGSAFPRLFTVSTFSVGAVGSSGTGGVASGGNPVVVGTSLESGSAAGYAVSLQGDIYYAPSQKDVCTALAAASGAA